MFIKYQIYKKQVSDNGMDWNDTDEKRKGSILGIYETLAACEGGEDPDTPYPDNPNDPDYGKPYSDRYFTIEMLEDGKVKLVSGSAWSRRDNKKYSINREDWVDFANSGTIYTNGISLKKGDVIRFRAEKNYQGYQIGTDSMFSVSGEFKVYGTLMSLTSNKITWVNEYEDRYVCKNMLRNNKTLVDASNLIFPDAAPDYAFQNMFSGCSNLKKAPKVLPAKVLGKYAYGGMFYQCQALTEAPELQFVEVDDYSCDNMFYWCTVLEKVQDILYPTELKERSYCSMFEYCHQALKKAPELPVTKMGIQSCEDMFARCTALVEGPTVLPAMEARHMCYAGMFRECTSLTKPPKLPATELVSSCYSGMFEKCTSLTEAPALPATTLANHCYYAMFKGCTSLEKAPDLLATELAEHCYAVMFADCTSLETAPDLLATTLVYDCYWSMFDRCSKLNYVKCLAEKYDKETCYEWLNDVSPTGTFIKKKGVNWENGASGIPTNWTVEEVD